MSGWILAAFHYQAPGENGVAVAQSALTKLGIRILTGPLPIIFFIAGVVVLSFYPITAAAYKEILRKVRLREEGTR
jgi:GPH family glycoside/pentoside/hexuronide:cation symporter